MAESWESGLAAWVEGDCHGDINAVHRISQHGVPPTPLVELMVASASVTGQKVELVVEPNIGGHEKAELTADSQQRKRKAGHSDEAPQPKRIRLVTPPHGPNCACGQLVALSAYRLAGKSVINKARECNLAMSDAHLFLDDSVPMTDTVAMMMGSTSVCTHAFCHTSHQAQLLRGALSRVPQEKMVFLDQDCKNQKRKFDIFDKAPPGTVLANRLVLGPVLATADKSSRAVFAVASAPRGMVKSDTKRYVCKIDFPTEDTVRHEIVSLTMLQDLTPHVVRLESVFSVRRHPVIGDATAIVMERLDWTVVDLMRARSSRPSQRVAFVLIRALEAAAAIHQCMHRIGAFNCDIRSANMGAFISSECLVPKLDAHCCPCEKHARRGLGVRIFDTGLLLHPKDPLDAEIARWINGNTREMATYISNAFPGCEELRTATNALITDTRIVDIKSPLFGTTGILVDNSLADRTAWKTEYVVTFVRCVNRILSARMGVTTVAAETARWCRQVTRAEMDMLATPDS